MTRENPGHADVGPELRQLAQAILDRLDPAVRAAAAKAADALRGPGRCQQVWCPVCALAALVSGEEHPLLTVVAEHSVARMTVIRAMATDPEARPGPQPEDPAPPAPAPNGGGSYQHIQIVVEDPGAPVDCP